MANLKEILENTKTYLNHKGFPNFESPGLLQPKFGYPFSPSAGHHIIDKFMISEQKPREPIKFSTVPDRSIRIYDLSKIGISKRHLSFFETIVFGYAGAVEQLPKEEAVQELYNLFLTLNLDPKKLLVTTLKHVKTEGTEIDENEDKIFYDCWVKLIGSEKVKRTLGRRNLFYSRVIDNPGGTGCELYYQIRDDFVEIGSQVNYKFKFTGGLERTRNAAILQGFGLERLLMALENKKQIGDTSLIMPIKQTVTNYLSNSEDQTTTSLYDESLTKIADHLRAITFIVYDKDNKNLTHSQIKIYKNLMKDVKSEMEYLGISNKNIYEDLVNTIINLYQDRYPDISSYKDRILENIKSISPASP